MILHEYRTSLCYAKILFKLTATAKSCTIEDVYSDNRFNQDLDNLEKFTSSRKNKYIIMALSKLSYDKIIVVMSQVLRYLDINTEISDFVEFLINHGKVHLIPHIVLVAKNVILKHFNREVCEIYFSHSNNFLDASLSENLSNFLAKKIGKKISVKHFVKKDLILGFRMMTPCLLLECTIAKCLQKVSLHLNNRVTNEK